MILIITNKGDVHCNPVIKHLNTNGDEFFRLNTEALLVDYELSFWVKNNRPQLTIRNRKNAKVLNSDKVTAVWERRPHLPVVPVQPLPDERVKAVITEETTELAYWLRHLFSHCRTIGSSVWDRPNESKLRQIATASGVISTLELPIQMPTSLLTTSKFEVVELAKLVDSVVVKPIGSDGIELENEIEMPFVSRKIPSKDLHNISEDDFRLCPTFIQAYIEKDYELRVTVVGHRHFCCKIDSQKLPVGKGREDWREGYDHGLPQEWISTPGEIEEFVASYLEQVNASFGCFDFIKAKDGLYYFLECNPNGQWMWQEEDIGMPISEAIADYLSFRAN